MVSSFFFLRSSVRFDPLPSASRYFERGRRRIRSCSILRINVETNTRISQSKKKKKTERERERERETAYVWGWLVPPRWTTRYRYARYNEPGTENVPSRRHWRARVSARLCVRCQRFRSIIFERFFKREEYRSLMMKPCQIYAFLTMFQIVLSSAFFYILKGICLQGQVEN